MITAKEAREAAEAQKTTAYNGQMQFVEKQIQESIVRGEMSTTLYDKVLLPSVRKELEKLGYRISWSEGGRNETDTLISWSYK